MARVRCDLPNADTEISGVAFMPMDGGGMLSEEIADEIAARFCSIPGYQPVEVEATAKATAKKAVKSGE